MLIVNVKFKIQLKCRSDKESRCEATVFFIRTDLVRDLYILTQGTEMNQYQLVEELNLSKQQLTPAMRYVITDNTAIEMWISIEEYLLGNLDRTHHVPGKIVATLIDMAREYQRVGHLTREQKIYFVSNTINYWDQLSCQARARLSI